MNKVKVFLTLVVALIIAVLIAGFILMIYYDQTA
jgi:hypothetical protein